ncbi:hypothetical protein L917_14481 [Phytophthora nicotianae]|uniref:Uncharacterized protein n=1 Tax=Phytophthora nicotianae TaxID=4792 RepID=W2KLK1_PHYNI|nr:hypothetical protein L917_14481 [Phytophthora nicotianae]
MRTMWLRSSLKRTATCTTRLLLRTLCARRSRCLLVSISLAR